MVGFCFSKGVCGLFIWPILCIFGWVVPRYKVAPTSPFLNFVSRSWLVFLTEGVCGLFT